MRYAKVESDATLKMFQSGSIGDEHYSPLILITNAGRHVYNAPMMAIGSASDISACNGSPDYNIKVNFRI